MKLIKNKTGFTLIELLIVIGVLVILSTAVVLIINPAQMLAQSRDGRRLSELQSLNKALQITDVQGGIFLGSPNTVYVSIPDPAASPTSTCVGLGLPSLPTGWSYQCSNLANYRKANGSGWIPVSFTSIYSGSPLSILPVDPINSTSTGNYYTYVTGGSWELTSYLESQKYKTKTGEDAGDNPFRYEVGTSLTLSPIVANIFLETGVCNNSTYCSYTDNHNEFDYIMSQKPWGLFGNSYRNGINDSSNPFGSADYYWSQYVFAFKADISGSYEFMVNSDDASELIKLNSNFKDENHQVVAYWYGPHGNAATCGTTIAGATSSIVLSSNEMLYLEFRQSESAGGQLSQLCIKEPGGSFVVVSTTNFPDQLFAPLR